MRTTISLMMVVIVASACATQRYSRATPVAAAKSDTYPTFEAFQPPTPEQEKVAAANIVYAQANFGKLQQELCIDFYKYTMHDPSSFQLIGTFSAHKSPFSRTGERIWLMAPMRGKNAMGGLIRASLACEYEVNAPAGTMRLTGARSL